MPSPVLRFYPNVNRLSNRIIERKFGQEAILWTIGESQKNLPKVFHAILYNTSSPLNWWSFVYCLIRRAVATRRTKRLLMPVVALSGILHSKIDSTKAKTINPSKCKTFNGQFDFVVLIGPNWLVEWNFFVNLLILMKNSHFFSLVILEKII